MALLLFNFSLGAAAVSFPPCGAELLAGFFLLGSFSWRGDGEVLLLPPSFSLLPLLVYTLLCSCGGGRGKVPRGGSRVFQRSIGFI